MAKIDTYTNAIANAVYGEEVRSSIINAINAVNDDNESYQSLKDEVVADKDKIDAYMKDFDSKVSTANTAKSNLQTAINNANTARTNLVNAISTVNTAKTNLDSATSTANTTKTNVETATKDANTAKTNAETAKTNLEKATATANSAKSVLETAIANANTAKSNLDGSTSTANTARTNLNNTISSANTAKSQLEAVINNADTIKSSLSDVISQANTAKTNLDSATSTANTAYDRLVAENTSATSNLSQLRDENFNSQEILSGVADLRAYLGLTDDDILGVQVDYKNKTFKRIAGATNLSAGEDFDKFSMFGGRKRCNVSDDGVITAYYGESGYKEDGSNGQVMVYQPKFYYLVCPVVYDPIATGIGYHLRKANYYVSEKPMTGFRLHPAFYDANGNEIDYVLMGAFEGSIWDASAGAYLLLDEQVMAQASDKLSSIANAKPASGQTQNLTRPNMEQMAQNRGAGFHLENIQITSMNQLLMLIEIAGNLQNGIANGVVSISDNSSYNCSSLTGSTSALGNTTGKASSTINEKGGAKTTETANGKTAISYRGLENPWGNIWKFIYGINIWGNGKMAGGQPYICTNLVPAESKNSDNYEGAGFTVTDKAGYISAMGYSTKYDWLFLPSECLGNSALPIGDYTWLTKNLDGYRIVLLGGCWIDGLDAGGFCWILVNGVGGRGRIIGGRLVYVPTAKVA